mgnify:FL=1
MDILKTLVVIVVALFLIKLILSLLMGIFAVIFTGAIIIIALYVIAKFFSKAH